MFKRNTGTHNAILLFCTLCAKPSLFFFFFLFIYFSNNKQELQTNQNWNNRKYVTFQFDKSYNSV